MNKCVCLEKYNNQWYKPGSLLLRLLWYFTNMIFFKTMLPWPSKLKCVILRIFGARIGKNVIIKPNVNIKYPWHLKIGNNVWIGEQSWLDSLTTILIGSNVVISQGSYLLTGSHDYKSIHFQLILKEIILEDGVWIGAKATVCPGVVCYSHSILTVGSIATKDLQAFGIYQGNPAQWKRKREIQ